MKPRDIIKMVAEFPALTVVRLVPGDHSKVYLDTPAGRKMLVVGKTSSDWRATLNNRSILRRWARGEA